MAYKSKATITRPANVTAYTAGDVVGGAFQLGNAPNGMTLLATTASLQINVAAVPSGMTSFRLHLYDATPPSAIADNAAWNLATADRDNYLGYIDLGSPVDCTDTLYVQVDQVNSLLKVANSGLYCYLVTNGGFTPAGNSEVYQLAAHFVPI